MAAILDQIAGEQASVDFRIAFIAWMNEGKVLFEDLKAQHCGWPEEILKMRQESLRQLESEAKSRGLSASEIEHIKASARSTLAT